MSFELNSHGAGNHVSLRDFDFATKSMVVSGSP